MKKFNLKSKWFGCQTNKAKEFFKKHYPERQTIDFTIDNLLLWWEDYPFSNPVDVYVLIARLPIKYHSSKVFNDGVYLNTDIFRGYYDKTTDEAKMGVIFALQAQGIL